MTYSLEFIPTAKTEWDKLGFTIKEQFKKKLSERFKSPHVPKDAVNGGNNLYKIKLRSVGYRLVYEVDDKRIIVLAIGKRNRNEVYNKLFSCI
ncbi:type II toxin-antitoxin system RelE family toxin [Candidatus Rickettsia kedanie]|uniref:Type II toxin-antitoxin system RelE/ParE family toxin n=1 Tax=Candidatus Rickettsia kedanie TaxID=3115352 RepID=A0ABP9TRZ1_9RICK